MLPDESEPSFLKDRANYGQEVTETDSIQEQLSGFFTEYVAKTHVRQEEREEAAESLESLAKKWRSSHHIVRIKGDDDQKRVFDKVFAAVLRLCLRNVD